MEGQTFSHYKILERIDSGGWGVVYRAVDTNLGRQVAIKFLTAERVAEPDSRRRFLHEARTQSMLSHSNITTFYEVGEEGEKAFIVMEYIEGHKLSELAKIEKLTLPKILDIVIQVGEGLQVAHEKKITHRDVNPNNIMVSSKGVAKITDFGLAKWKGDSSVTPSGAIVGTDCYIPPELFNVDEGKADHRADVFSLGVVLYELICARRPFEGETKDSIYYEILYTQPQPLARYCRGVPEALEQVVFKCLAKAPDERYQSAADLVADLKVIKRKLDSGETDFQLKRFGRRPFRRIVIKISFSLTGVAIVLAGLYALPWSRDFVKKIIGVPTIPPTENLVILPFTNAGSDPNNQALCDGLGETVNRKLSQLEKWEASLRVVPVSDVRYYNVYGAEEARKIFGAALAVGGNVERMGNGVRLTLELVDTKSKRLKPLRSAVAYYTMANAAAFPDWTVRKMAEMLKIELPPQTLQELARGGSSNSSASLSYLRARGCLQHTENPENLDMAIALFGRALRDDPLYALAYAGLGEAYWRRYQIAKESRWKQLAVDNCARAIQLDEQLVSAHLNLGVIYAGGDRYQNAIGEFQKVLKLDSLNVEAYRGLAGSYQGLGQNSQVESTYLKAIKVRPNYPAGYSYLGAFYSHLGLYEKAAAQLERVVEFAPENYRAYNNVGAIYLYLARVAEAERMFKRSLEIQPDYVAAYSNLGSLYFFEVARYAEAARTYEKARDVDSSDYRVWGSLAAAYYEVPGERARADTAYRRAIEMAEEQRKTHPKDAMLLSYLAGYYATLGDRRKAAPLLEQSLALAPADPEVLARAGETYEQLGQREMALQWIGKALERGYSLKLLNQWPGLRKLREDARFLQMAEKVANKIRN